jgi:DNA polymerase I-like protein with 3'-5' exonuclease and polymerase domains
MPQLELFKSDLGKKPVRDYLSNKTVPEIEWSKPKEFPNLIHEKAIGLDVETKDLNLKEKGPGWAYDDGYIVGVSLSVSNKSWYFPIRHAVNPHDNLNPDHVKSYLKDTLATQSYKIGANLTYDIGWLEHEDIKVNGPLVDVEFAEALLTETDEVALEVLGQKYLQRGKNTSSLFQWAASAYGGKIDEQRHNIWRCPPSLVANYASFDASLPLDLATILYRRLSEQGLVEVFNLECALIPLLLEMRRKGVLVDLEKAEQLSKELVLRVEKGNETLSNLVGYRVDCNSGPTLARLFDSLGVNYQRTEKGAPSFTKSALQEMNHPIADQILEVRRLEKLNGTFIRNYVLNGHYKGRLHCIFHPLRTIEHGTRSGRFAASNPNLQNIPVRDKELGKLIRSLFIPEAKEKWAKFDCSQIEYRFLVHYAVGNGSDAARKQYNDDPQTDFHRWTQGLIESIINQKIDRRPVKTINFGLTYGMGEDKLRRSLNMSRSAAKGLFQSYHRGVPFVKATMQATMNEANKLGYITTVSGRRSRFDRWVQRDWSENIEQMSLPHAAALAKWGPNIQRAYIHKALNRRLQGSAADLMKLAMLRCWKEGIFKQTGVPSLTIHDELDFSVNENQEKALPLVKEAMQDFHYRVPILVTMDLGKDWGEVEH